MAVPPLVLRLWRLPAEPFLTGPVSLMPLALMAGIRPDELSGVGREIGRRLNAEHDFAKNDRTVTMISVLMRLRYDNMTTQELLASIPDVEEYPGFKMFLDKGRAQGREEGRLKQAQEVLIKLGSKRFGPPATLETAAIQNIHDVDRLVALNEKLFEVAGWQELLKDA